jgi:hypothetical protein
MKNCYVNICGGVGNQLFQIAAGYAYARKWDKKLIINTTHWTASQGNHPDTYKDTIFKNFEYGTYHTRDIIHIHEKRFNYDELPYHHGSVALNGYFQSLKYFEEYKDEFILKLNLPKIIVQKFEGDNTIAFHIRRGDYLKYPDIHYICDTKYFEYFFDIFMPEHIKGTKILVFTDSPEYVTEEFKNKEFHIIHSESDVKELAYMSQCDIIIGSNSSFSWWASLIGNKPCYFPSKWFKNEIDHSDIFRKDMILQDV